MNQENGGIKFLQNVALPEHTVITKNIIGPTLKREARFSEMLHIIFHTTQYCDTEHNTNINCFSGIHYWHVCMTLKRNVNPTLN